MTEITKKGRKRRRHVYVSREFDGVTDRLLPDHRNFSKWAEGVLWEALVEEYGQEAVLEAVEEVQNDMDKEEILLEKNWESLEIPS